MPYYERTIGTPTPAMRGFIVSFLLLMGAVPAFFAGQLADRYGQLSVVMVGSIIFTLGAILQGAAPVLPVLLVGRALAGLGEGLWLSNVSVYVGRLCLHPYRDTDLALSDTSQRSLLQAVGGC